MTHPPVALTIAASDPSGGAGIQADLKAFSANGAYGTAVLTALTAQNTQGVTGIHAVPPAFVREQIDTLFADVEVDAVKIGMLADAGIAAAVAEALERHRPRYVVLDPVMVSTSGHRLLEADAVAVVRERLLPLADLITPNLPEAGDLLGVAAAQDRGEAVEQARALLETGARRVLLKGGHHTHDAESVDVLVGEGTGVVELSAPRVDTRNTHGTGCTLSAAIAALRPQCDDWHTAVRAAKDYLTGALRAADTLRVGRGNGPVHHFHQHWS
ncbi:hydroxymethylpyrimidine/phosphomethylpyrimidine kinase [Streptomyces spiroverticillatus]|uniref:Hydroxymethylpyrimidine/phosphomethylpyrimidine kinase n=1 Tax=Streptomyces finlayi TaxID=67296 RepID=A0A919CFV9_9ACTN|nr:bifunctional hydroxymethylpyrimidine kinase/phosphomethylpyrimidine kinase [Streptomyces finlayi]GHA47359.1 hydroxymethylpyrimidine/phosphomethylpyrimidine kinase [Streptomyces spiroverticillatus]GHD18548.1 hydroxymethylpyrimidine/phosphomethylpyrimidine kinase [Streptomyces finlayi]